MKQKERMERMATILIAYNRREITPDNACYQLWNLWWKGWLSIRWRKSFKKCEEAQ